MSSLFWAAAAVILIGLGAISVLQRRTVVRVSAWERQAVYIDGGLDRVLAPGRHVFWTGRRRLMTTPISLAPQYASLPPVDAVSADGLPLRLTATVVYRLHDPDLSLSEPVWEPLNLAGRAALIRLAGAHDLKTLMSHAPELEASLSGALGGTIGAATVLSVSLTGVILPPELRRLMIEVERARLEGAAALERARGEQAALRSLANAARLLKDNPELAQLRTLQAVAASKNATLIVGDTPSATGSRPRT